MMRYTWVLVHRCAGLAIALFAVAPEGFGPFSKRLLVGNFGDGTLVAFGLKSGPRTSAMKRPFGSKGHRYGSSNGKNDEAM